MITPFRDLRGQPAAMVRCDGCGVEITIKADAERRRGPKGDLVLNDGQISRKLTAKGWDIKAQREICPGCVAQRREASKAKEDEMSTPEPEGLCQPTRDQKREIMAMLQDVYDTKAQRYRAAETDKTIADTLGDGILFGWVAKLREEFFGPDGNEAVDQMIEQAKMALARCDSLAATLHDQHDSIIKTMRDFSDARSEVGRLIEKLSGRPLAVAR